MSECYRCHKVTLDLSPRYRCAKCEWKSNQLNELENEELRNALEECRENLKWWKEIAREKYD